MIKIGYWFFKGRAEICKTVATFLEIPFEEVDYTDFKDWFANAKFSLGLDFPNLPYLIDGNVKVTESPAISIYLVNKANKPELLGTTALERAHVRMLCDIFESVGYEIPAIARKEGGKELLCALDESNPHMMKLAQAEEYLGDKKWFLGDKISLADAIAAWPLYMSDLMIRSAGGTSMFVRFPKLGALLKRFHDLPQIKARRESEAYKNRPVTFVKMVPFPVLEN